MAGLMPQQPAAPAPEMAPQADPRGLEARPEAAEQGEEGEAASPESQQQYDEFVGRAYLTIFDEKAGALRQGIADMLRDEDPVAALAETVATIYGRVADAARQGGAEISPDVRQGAITEIFEKLAEISELLNGDFMKDDKDFEQAYLQAVDAVRLSETASGGVDQAAEAERLKTMEG